MGKITRRRAAGAGGISLSVLIAAILVASGLSFVWNQTQSAPAQAVATAGPAQLRGVDGGPDYFRNFPNSLPTDPSYFPIGIWQESLTDLADAPKDRVVGINLYVDLTSNSDITLATNQGMHALPSTPFPTATGRMLSDEVDMWAGPGDAAWTGIWPGYGPICTPENQRCGYTVQRDLRKSLPAGTMVYANYGKGVTFWETNEQAAVFINEFQDVVSADTYWFTDPFICGPSEGGAVFAAGGQLAPEKCRLAANYGWTIERLRSLVTPAKSKPVWAFVEVGHPFTEADAPNISGPEIRAAVWSSLIHGARGIVYFNHNFGGDCQTQHVLRDPCGDAVRPWVTDVNAQITRLAPVLNAPFLDNALSHGEGIDAAVKVRDGSLYVLAGAGAAVTVLDENRTVTMADGAFSDHFADGNAVHLYKIDGGAASCVK
ncbi:hypothetical protein [Arthrobacter sp. ISL-69]|uniref:hypothetical protein n=1 Tax=Arthrobacter sp. ISL-69 TaxID=2819113 RepID=UPI001BE67319|nr:hypothetical protein [Arthrobacter sp. ISL-69]MBT2538213.1 hypothetical protein [Arthrobacter sp. ISL-69]